MKKLLKKNSLTVKWSMTSSMLIFLILAVFAVIVYKFLFQTITTKEKIRLYEIVSIIDEKLSRSGVELNSEDVELYLKESPHQGEPINSLSQRTNTDVRFDDSDLVLNGLAREEIYLTIYDTQGKAIFRSQQINSELENQKEKNIQTKTIDGKTGLLLEKAIHSKETDQVIGYIQFFYDLSFYENLKNNLFWLLSLLVLLILILSWIIGIILSTYYLKPLKLLRNTMETIRKNPQSTINMPNINSNDELSDLAEIFNEMIARMRRYIEQQERFVEDVSHELRTPVAVIEGHLNLLNRWGKEDPEILDESLDASLQEITRMKSLVQEMLDLSRMEQADVHYSDKVTAAKQVVYHVFNNFKLVYPDFTITLDDDLNEDINIAIYHNHFEQLLIIILDNAIKYSTTRKEIHISIARTLNHFDIAIQDFGEGIAMAELDLIFDRFYRVDKARARKTGGSGLGLSIAKKLVENYKGHIDVESVIGQGSVFRIRLPIVSER